MYIFSFVLILLLILAIAAVRIIFDRMEQVDRQNGMVKAWDQSILLRKELDLLDQRLGIFLRSQVGHAGFPTEMYNNSDTLLPRLFRFSSDEQRLSVIPFRKVQRRGETLQIYLDLDQLHVYLGDTYRYARGYITVFTAEGFCLMSPDASQLGTMHPEGRRWRNNLDGKVLHSAYLDLPVREFVYELNYFGTEDYMLVSVPIFEQDQAVRDVLFISLVLGTTLIFTVVAFSISLYLQRKKEHRFALAHANMQKEQALARFERLREQMNPHFLFNALGSLQQLVKQDQDRAQMFVGKMAKMYRTMLRQDPDVYASLEEELSLATAYLFLQEIRFKNAFTPIDVQVNKQYLRRLLPRWSLQIIVENAIKHNEFTPVAPLSIQIAVDGDRLVVSNNYRPKSNTDTESGGYGLRYIHSVYQAEGRTGFDYRVDVEYFTVYLPFL
ncbi:sensor histidine kinase [Sphingobacterium sp. SGR-19]|uniref:sensor histidine kinase n=1 Tax=Sphingobacterium sp. SGR-19 TaxID=2710886 RepID=UPI0013EBDD52|nr:sensor histidine kinase [Sphingobacterium sp. SGR-19]NGM67072.1 histidine kinase [Sphingobacterium sp. SGR-19]